MIFKSPIKKENRPIFLINDKKKREQIEQEFKEQDRRGIDDKLLRECRARKEKLIKLTAKESAQQLVTTVGMDRS
ncbi:1410_t:CDS:2 [Racocetra fulgida]|uniref:1410_t:CDS:1 n=1 Tax=Racocetra fulgida TaxID=60492 RepID=A0A9N9GL85_9GLOM|nr:1410_t:CDS:2 [Racocetra fulgida]